MMHGQKNIKKNVSSRIIQDIVRYTEVVFCRVLSSSYLM